MAKDIVDRVRRIYEEEYFHQQDAKLLEKMRAVFRKQKDREAIRTMTGIRDDALLDQFVALGLDGESIAGFQLYPLIEVALADGEVDEKEAAAVLSAAVDHGIKQGGAAYRLLESSLRNGKHRELADTWRAYAAELKRVLAPEELAQLRANLLDAAQRVAEASGGFLGIVFKQGDAEKSALAEIERELS